MHDLMRRRPCQPFRKKRTCRELDYEESLDGQSWNEEEEEAECKGEDKTKGKKKSAAKKKPKATPAKLEGETLDPKKVTIDTEQRP